MSEELRAQRLARVEQVMAAFVEGIKKHLPLVENVELHPDAIIDLFRMGIIDAEQKQFDEFIDGLKNPGPPVPEDSITRLPDEIKPVLAPGRHDQGHLH